MDMVDKIMAFEGGELGAEDTIELFIELGNSGLVNQLQGSYGRSFVSLVEGGYIAEGESDGVHYWYRTDTELNLDEND